MTQQSSRHRSGLETAPSGGSSEPEARPRGVLAGSSAAPGSAWRSRPGRVAFPRNGAGARRYRIALYSHDTMGLGHTRRNLLIAQTLAASGQPSILMLAGAREAGAFAMPPGVDVLTLPALHKRRDGRYQARYLDMPLRELIGLRSKAIRTALEAFQPDVFIVDKAPRGALGELDPTLAYLRARGRTGCVLGLRDVLDEPPSVRDEWSRATNDEAIRDYYDTVWVYGDPTVYDSVREYGFSGHVAAKVRYTGYLDPRKRLDLPEVGGGERLVDLGLPPGRLALCLVGGGQDGARLAEAFAQADLPPGTNGVILTGPFMPPEARERLHRSVARRPRARVLDFVAEPDRLLSRADRVIAMGGYNTVLEVLSFEKRALIVPRVKPRTEQLIRAERLRELGLLDVLHPDEVHPDALAQWLARDFGPPPRARGRIDLNGLVRLPRLLEAVLAARPYRAASVS